MSGPELANRWRPEFPSLEGVLHFVSHSLGAMPRGVERDLADYAAQWRDRGIRAWPERWLEVPAEVAASLESLLHAAAGTVSLHPNVTVAQAVALSAIEFAEPRRRVICTAEDFPSELHLYEGLERRGAQIVRVPAREGRWIDVDDVVRSIDERTAVVAVSHVLFRTSQCLALEPIVRRAREVGAISLVDAYQSVGVVPVDVAALEVDLLTGGSIKWLCGGPGTGFLYASPRIAPRLRPALTGWFGHERPFDFDAGPQQLATGARRFANGTPCIPAYQSARAGFGIVARIGAEALRAHSLAATTRLIAHADALALKVASPREPSQRGGTVCLDVPNAPAVCDELLAENVLLDHRPGVGLRLAPHFYTLDAEIDAVMERVARAVRRHA